MQGIHDLGGMDGFTLGQRDGTVFAEDWERDVWGLLFTLGSIPGVSLPVRLALEAVPPALYLSLPLYARLLYIEEQAVLASGLVTLEELADPDGPLSDTSLPNFDPVGPGPVLAFAQQDASARLDTDAPARFAVGDSVVVNGAYPFGHTRVPGYVRGRRGTVVKDHGVYPFEDALPPGVERRPQHVYSVRFTGEELWGARGHPRDVIHVDLWDDHLESVDA